MIRVFGIAVLAFAALILVTRNLPDSAFRPAPGAKPGEVAAPPSVEALVGVWEGTVEMTRMDGTSAGSLGIRQVRSIEPTGVQRIAIEERAADGAIVTTEVEIVRRAEAGAGGDLFERTERRSGAPARLWQGRLRGETLVWSFQDAATGEKQSFREELMKAADGPILAVDGAGLLAGKPLLFAGRYRRVE